MRRTSRPCAPKHVKRPEPEPVAEVAPEPEPETEIEVAIEVTAEAEAEIAATTDPEVISEQEATAELNEAPKSTTEEAASQPEVPALQNSDVFSDEAEDASARRSRRYRVDAEARDAAARHLAHGRL